METMLYQVYEPSGGRLYGKSVHFAKRTVKEAWLPIGRGKISGIKGVGSLVQEINDGTKLVLCDGKNLQSLLAISFPLLAKLCLQ